MSSEDYEDDFENCYEEDFEVSSLTYVGQHMASRPVTSQGCCCFAAAE
jgi:hypothetical protein